MMGIFVQLNEGRIHSEKSPVGYVIQEHGCWQWVGALTDRGYARFWDGARRVQAHRHVYEIHKGPIPAGMELDHLCRNRSCVNPDHLEPVTHRVNTLRGDSPHAVFARQETCARGHRLDEGNLVAYALTRRRTRACRECALRRSREYRARQKAMNSQERTVT